jgi:hypothetical protein
MSDQEISELQELRLNAQGVLLQAQESIETALSFLGMGDDHKVVHFTISAQYLLETISGLPTQTHSQALEDILTLVAGMKDDQGNSVKECTTDQLLEAADLLTDGVDDDDDDDDDDQEEE